MLVRKFAIVALLAAAPSIALANTWGYKSEVDKFDGSKKEIAFVDAADGRSAVVVWAGHDGKVNLQFPTIIWHLRTDYLCAIDESVYVHWVVADAAGEILKAESFSSWDPTNDRKRLEISTDEKWGEEYNDGQLLFMWMNASRAAEVRFRYNDSCGKQYTDFFPLDGFTEAWQRVNRTP